MNDITALMATMKAAAEEASCRGELIVQVNTGNVLALVEALEARDKQIAELEQRNNKLSDWGGRIEKLLKSTEESLIYSVDMMRELESRTVKLPLAVSVGGQGCRDQVVDILAAAGIKVIEGEGQ